MGDHLLLTQTFIILSDMTVEKVLHANVRLYYICFKGILRSEHEVNVFQEFQLSPQFIANDRNFLLQKN